MSVCKVPVPPPRNGPITPTPNHGPPLWLVAVRDGVRFRTEIATGTEPGLKLGRGFLGEGARRGRTGPLPEGGERVRGGDEKAMAGDKLASVGVTSLS